MLEQRALLPDAASFLLGFASPGSLWCTISSPMDSVFFRHPDSPAQLPPQVGSLCSTQKDLTNNTQHQYFPTQTGTPCPHGQFGILSHTGDSRFPCADQTTGSPVKDPAGRQTALQSQSSRVHQVFFLSPEALQIFGVRSFFLTQKHFAPSLLETQHSFFLNPGATTFPSLSKSLKTLFSTSRFLQTCVSH